MGYYLALCAILRIYQYFYHDAAYSLDGVCVRCSECERAQYRGLSVCLSVTVVYCVEIASDNYYQTT